MSDGNVADAIPASLPLRNDLVGEVPYGAPQLNVPVCLNVNENPYSPAPEVIDAIVERVRVAAKGLNRYPDREHMELRGKLADYLRAESHAELTPEQLWAANGSNEIMLQLFQAFGGPGRTALGFAPTYSMYPEYARDTFTTWDTVARNDDFSLNMETALAAIHTVKPAIVLITSPNNPTGTPLSHDEARQILDACAEVSVEGADPSAHPVVVIDEAYVEFRNPGVDSVAPLIAQYDHLAVSRTLSKAFAYAGARVGYLAANKAIIDSVRIVRMPYHLSALTQAAALAALEHADVQLAQVSHLRDVRNDTATWLATQTYKGQALKVAESQSNFLLFGGIFDDREAIFKGLLDRGILIRVVGPDGWLRVCMGTDEEMAAFRTGLGEVLREVESR
ncbi:MAG: histidinol-phosphate transaminase [Bifidobacteriaceae bacterium]|jgi:histidinol-phosphate aminotransferase|nr:histidinol-phosphate transaminase [Bifidobacteriaceae bacterium]